MQLPDKVPGIKWLTILVAVYAVLWISLEGSIGQALLLSAGFSILLLGYLYQRFLGGRHLSYRAWLLISTVAGLLLGLLFGLLTLLLMAVKTGLHGHGPEFSPDQISWLLQQIPLWSVIGLIAGLGLGLIVAGFNGYGRRT